MIGPGLATPTKSHALTSALGREVCGRRCVDGGRRRMGVGVGRGKKHLFFLRFANVKIFSHAYVHTAYRLLLKLLCYYAITHVTCDSIPSPSSRAFRRGRPPQSLLAARSISPPICSTPPCPAYSPIHRAVSARRRLLEADAHVASRIISLGAIE